MIGAEQGRPLVEEYIVAEAEVGNPIEGTVVS
jgi:hypothetical protein